MDVRIGVTHTPKELEIAVGETASPEELRKQVDDALTQGGTLWITDRRGRQVGVPVERLAYVEIGVRDTDRRVGFGG